MKKLKVVTVVGTRPEIIRLSRLIPKLDEFTDHILVHTGQNYDPQLSDVFFRDLELRQPDYYLNVDTSSFGSVMGDTLKKSEEIFLKEKPDAVMILGDTNSAVAAIVAERLQIPVYHMEAGNRSYDKRVPEELNRRMIDHVATYNLVYTETARSNLLREGIPAKSLFKTGSPLQEVFDYTAPKLAGSDILAKLNLETNDFFLASLHRQENVDSKDRLAQIIGQLESLASRSQLPVVLSLHPRTRMRIAAFDIEPGNIRICEPFGYVDYLKLQLSARCVVSDSGSLGEEAAICGFPAVHLRPSTERPEALEDSSFVLVHPESQMLWEAVDLATLSISKKASSVTFGGHNFSNLVMSYLLATSPGR